MNILARRFPLFCLLAALLASVSFLPALNGGFVLDDGVNILDNRVLYMDTLDADSVINATFSFHNGTGARPLPMLSFALDYWRTGAMDASAFKTTNMIVHALTTFILAFLFRRLLLLAACAPAVSAWGALALALVWAVHPLQISSVMYVVQRMQTMATLFLVLAFWAYLCMRQVQINDAGRGRMYGVLVLLFWLLALACKEDASLLFAYLLVLELTVLRFRAAQPDVVKGLKQSFMMLTVVGGLAYFFVVVPHYWHWDSYSGRDFSSLERLMTQARVLAMHIGQIVFPYPDNMTFLYDDLVVSRSLWNPWTTLPSILLILALLVWAWLWRVRSPLFSLGVFLFFSGHFITSNVIGLELVFEHRNHFPLIGAVLAIGSLSWMLARRWQLKRSYVRFCLATVFVVLSSATVSRAYIWGDPVRHGQKQVELLPTSIRAWTQLGGAHFDLYKATEDDEHLYNAIEVNAEGLKIIEAPQFPANIVIYKSFLGTVTDEDWELFLDVLRDSPRNWRDKFVVWSMMKNVDLGFEIDSKRVLEAIEILSHKTNMRAAENLRLAVFVYKNGEQQRSLPYFREFVQQAPADDANASRIIKELADAGRENWAEQLIKIQEAKPSSATQ